MRRKIIFLLLMTVINSGQAHGETVEQVLKKYYPLSDYRRFPQSVRPLMQQIDFQHSVCRNGFDGQDPDGPESMKACNKAYELLVLLEDKGWCWGGSHTEAEKHWLACWRDPYYEKGLLKQDGKPFSDKDIENAARP